jgi:tRNA threonylcarbamoyl adenosine modification protein YeaZ
MRADARKRSVVAPASDLADSLRISNLRFRFIRNLLSSFETHLVKILAVDTSGFEGSVAISEDRHVLNQRCLNAEGRRHAQMLVLEVGELLKSQRLKPADIDIVAVSIGPGSFTGLRVGVVFAKTFAWANNAKLVAVDTLQAVAQRNNPA